MSPRNVRTDAVDVDVVVPSVGRPSLDELLDSLADARGPLPGRVLLADDRPAPSGALLGRAPAGPVAARVEVVRTGGRGPAAARNAAWRRSRATWIAFLDDDVQVDGDWLERLRADLAELPPEVAASQGRIAVPLAAHRRPTDWERNVAGLERARWATADMAYRRRVLEEVGGFDERFPRAYREDADLGLRVTDMGYAIVRGRRQVRHPVGPAEGTVSLRMQAGNAEDPFMRALHGRRWRRRAGVPAGRRRWHLATVLAAGTAGLGLVTGRPRTAGAGALLWSVLTADFAWRRIAPGPRTGDEVRRMVGTSVVLPFVATAHWARGIARVPRRLRRPGPAGVPPGRLDVGPAARSADADEARRPPVSVPAAVLFDRDGTLIVDVPYNGDPEAVRPVPGARRALERLRGLGVPTAVVTNQSGIGRGWLTEAQAEAVDARVQDLLGPLGPIVCCPHAPHEGCRCRKPSPALVEEACSRLGVDPRDCVVVGDIGADMEAAGAAGARGILVPTDATRQEEVEAAPEVATDLDHALELALGRRPAVEAVAAGGRP